MADTLIALDSVTHLDDTHRGQAAYCASHGGSYAGYYAAKSGIGAVILNDAGVGREQAGIAGLALLDDLGVPAAAVSHRSARIGDGADGLARGTVSFLNATAQNAGLAIGMNCSAALDRLAQSDLAPSPAPTPLSEARFEENAATGNGIRVIVADSNSLVGAKDIGQIFVTGSHGGLLGGRPETAVKIAVFAAVYNDADRGKDDAGISRLPALDERGIAGACVSAFSARIGDGRSTLEDGYISALNETAQGLGGTIGQSCREFVSAMAEAKQRTESRNA